MLDDELPVKVIVPSCRFDNLYVPRKRASPMIVFIKTRKRTSFLIEQSLQSRTRHEAS